MAYANFKQTFWSKHIQHELEKRAILAEFCNKQFTGEAKFGNSVKILGVGRPTVGSYTGASIGTPETVADSSVIIFPAVSSFEATSFENLSDIS